MVLQVVVKLFNYILPSSEYYVPTAITVTTLLVTHAFAQGRKTTRERDLYARTIIVTGAFTPLGMTLIQSLASRGAHIIAISQYDPDHTQPSLIIPLLRTATNNENIYAEHADLSSPASIRALCTKFLKGDDKRIDAIVFAHEYTGIGSIFGLDSSWGKRREEASLATFLMTTHLLSALLVAPVERDIRIINVVNPFYAAAIPSFIPKLTSAFSPGEPDVGKPGSSDSVFVAEGSRSLVAAILSRHLQRILDALPNRAPALEGIAASKTKPKYSNISVVSVSPGINRSETVGPLLKASTDGPAGSRTYFGLIIYICLYPLIWLLAKSQKAAMQSILHVLFLPTPFKRIMLQLDAAADPSATAASSASSAPSKPTLVEDVIPEELLKPGALYRECSVVKVDVPSLPEDFIKKRKADEKSRAKKGKKKADDKEEEEEFMDLNDDGEMGGEAVGRTVWEWYEVKLKEWEAKERAEFPERYEEKKPPAPQTPQASATNEEKK